MRGFLVTAAQPTELEVALVACWVNLGAVDIPAEGERDRERYIDTEREKARVRSPHAHQSSRKPNKRDF